MVKSSMKTTLFYKKCFVLKLYRPASGTIQNTSYRIRNNIKYWKVIYMILFFYTNVVCENFEDFYLLDNIISQNI